jgi:DNA-binding transcriptional ArsR family regulator
MLVMASTFEVVAEPNRRQILDLLRGHERPVQDLVTELGLAQPAVSKHLRVLREAGLVTASVDAQRRLYRLRAAPLRELDAWVAPYREYWEGHLDALERHLSRAGDARPERSKR